MSDIIALYDACVLYPAPLRDFLMHLALTDLFKAKWSEKIHDEWISSLLKNRKDLSREKLERTRKLMNQSAEECLVHDYNDLIQDLVLPDPNDRHVLAAAIKCKATVIVTYNLQDFPLKTLKPYNIDMQNPDTFICYLLDLNPELVCSAAKRQRGNLKNPPKSISEFLELFKKLGLNKTTDILTKYSELL